MPPHTVQTTSIPLIPLLMRVVGAVALGAGGWSLAAWASGWEVLPGALGAVVVGVASVAGLLAIQPWKVRGVDVWGFIWLGGSLLRMVVSVIAIGVVYLALPDGPISLVIGAIATYFLILAGETHCFAQAMRQAPPVQPPVPATECSAS